MDMAIRISVNGPLVYEMELNAVISVCGLLVTKYKNQILLCTKKKQKIKYWFQQWITRYNLFKY